MALLVDVAYVVLFMLVSDVVDVLFVLAVVTVRVVVLSLVVDVAV